MAKLCCCDSIPSIHCHHCHKVKQDCWSYWTFGWHHLSNTKSRCLFPLQLFNVESADTTDFHWVEFFSPVKLQNDYRDRLGLHDSQGSPWDQTRHVLLQLVLRDFAKLLFADSEWKTKLLHKPIELTFDHRGKEKLFSGVNYEQACFFFQANVTNHTG